MFKLFLEGWLTELDRDRFEVTGFHTGATSDELTALAAGLCDRFVQDLPSAIAWREAISDTAPHVLLYPEIGMDPMAGWLAAQRLAPVQCVSWGHPETTGMPTVDYFLSSDLMEPPDGETHYTERMVRLPRLGLHYAPRDVRPDADRSRVAGGGAVGAGVLVRAVAVQVSAAVRLDVSAHRRGGGGVPVCLCHHGDPALTAVFRERLGRAFAACGLDAEDYCVILPSMPHNNYIGVARAADVMLDPPGWSGGKSTLDCLLVNPAIVTLPGRFMRGRHTAAILRRIGCEATIATSPDEYVAIAARLAARCGVADAGAAGGGGRKPRAFRDTGYVRALERFLTDAVAFA